MENVFLPGLDYSFSDVEFSNSSDSEVLSNSYLKLQTSCDRPSLNNKTSSLVENDDQARPINKSFEVFEQKQTSKTLLKSRNLLEAPLPNKKYPTKEIKRAVFNNPNESLFIVFNPESSKEVIENECFKDLEMRIFQYKEDTKNEILNREIIEKQRIQEFIE